MAAVAPWVWNALTAAVAVYGASEAHRGAEAQKKAAREAERLGKLEEERAKAETAESVSRAQKAQEQLQSMTRARIAASGVSATGSMSAYLDEMMKTHKGELDWMKKAGATRADAASMEGRYAAQTGRAAAKSSAAGAASSWGSAISNIHSTGQAANWWG